MLLELEVAKVSRVVNYTCGCHEESFEVGAYAGSGIVVRCPEHTPAGGASGSGDEERTAMQVALRPEFVG